MTRTLRNRIVGRMAGYRESRSFADRRPDRTRSAPGIQLGFDALEDRQLLATLSITGGELTATANATYQLYTPSFAFDSQSLTLGAAHAKGAGVAASAQVGNRGFPADLGLVVERGDQQLLINWRVWGASNALFRASAAYSETVRGSKIAVKIVPEIGESVGTPIVLRIDSRIPSPSGAIGGTVDRRLSVNASVNGNVVTFDNSVDPLGPIVKRVVARIGDTLTIDGYLSESASIPVEKGQSREFYSGSLVQTIFNLERSSRPDLSVTPPALDKDQGIDFNYRIDAAGLAGPTSVGLYWSTDARFDATQDAAAFGPTSTATGLGWYPVHVDRSQLSTPPLGAKYLLAVIDPSNSVAEADESNGSFGPNNVMALDLARQAKLSVTAITPGTFITTDTLTVHASIGVPMRGVQVLWTVQGQDAAAGITGFPMNVATTTDSTGSVSFAFTPSDNPNLTNNRRTKWTAGSLEANPAIAFQVTARITLDGQTSEQSRSVSQDEKDRLRQEYHDYGIAVPARNEVIPSLPGAGFNRGNYKFQLSVGLDTRFDAILAAYRGSQIAVTIDGQQYSAAVPTDAKLVISSGYRNPQRNKKKSKLTRTSMHMFGRALDMQPQPVQVVIMVNGRPRRVTAPLHGASGLYVALYHAAAKQGQAIPELNGERVRLGSGEDHTHVEW